MAVRTAYVGTQSAGDVLTSANFTKLPGGWIGYNEVTANQTGIANSTPIDLTSLSVAVTVGTTRRIKITAEAYFNTTSGTNGICGFFIRESGTTLQQRNFTITNNGESALAHATVVLTPSSGAHTYKLSANTNSAGNVITMNAAATFPAFILVEDIGPAS